MGRPGVLWLFILLASVLRHLSLIRHPFRKERAAKLYPFYLDMYEGKNVKLETN